ncbi:amidohydrolase 2 [Stereum hirsutum FP-91666 SS1]|uniref:amidohydrolase 2 n=1 Tax=Stereum hirsutum (strain FP-91666) TaxID=721885 RepID=UPI000440F445|nr:amidohydrolase 2 [Stereum hirsutum FP-91666 SS1]EIM88074.1 amidohydrolase 2 [Stereum hirsutum FP-91666 SS1]
MSSTHTHPTPPDPGLIDVHHHFFPPNYTLFKQTLSHSLGFRTPPENFPWSASSSLRAMDTLGIELAILSTPAGYPHLEGEEGRKKTREANAQMGEICKCEEWRGRFRFWGCVGDMRDTQVALEMIKYSMDELGAVGIAVASCYGNGSDAKYIGDDIFDPIWEDLNRRSAIVFLHGAQIPSSTPCPNEFLGVPVTEVPNETTKAISHLVTSLKTLHYPQLTFLLSHLGGTLTALAPRVAALARYMGSEMSEEAILREFGRCWLDCGLSCGEGSLRGVEAMTAGGGEGGGLGRVVYGSDYPAVSIKTIEWFKKNLVDYCGEDEQKLDGVRRGNVVRLFESHGIDILASRA